MIRKPSLYTLLLGAAALVGATANANTITPQLTAFSPGVSITYTADLTSAHMELGDGFTIFDIGGFTSVLSVPLNWTSSVSNLGSPWGIDPFGGAATDNPALPNVTFTYTGPDVHQEIGASTYGPFVIGTTGTVLVIDSWTSRDHALTPIGPDQWVFGAPHTDQIQVPAVAGVPDGGSTVGLLGLALVGLAALRRRFMS